jgi:hypothetical protein
MNFTTAPLSWHWGIIFLVCVFGAVATGRQSRFYALFWWPLVTLGGISTFTLFKSWGAGPRDGPSGLVVLFSVLPVTIVSLLGVATGLVCLWKHPGREAAKPMPMVGGIIVSALALLFTTRAEMQSVTVRVLDGNGKTVSRVTVDATASDGMSHETSKKAVTGDDGSARFEFSRFRTITVSATAPDCYQTAASFGQTGYSRKGWTIWWSGSLGLGTMFLPQAFNPETVDLHLRGRDELVLPDVKQRLGQSLSADLNDNEATYALAMLGTNFESFEIMDQIPASGALRGSYGTLLNKQADLLKNCFQELDSKVPRDRRRFFRFEEDAMDPSDWNGLARWAGIQGDKIPVTPENLQGVDDYLHRQAEKLLDAAELTLDMENSAAGVYSELRFVARHRLPELKEAYQRVADPRAKRQIYFALRDFKPSFDELEPMITASQPMEALQLLMCIEHDKDWADYQRARDCFRKLDSQPHPLPDPNLSFNHVETVFQQMRMIYSEADARWANKQEKAVPGGE